VFDTALKVFCRSLANCQQHAVTGYEMLTCSFLEKDFGQRYCNSLQQMIVLTSSRCDVAAKRSIMRAMQGKIPVQFGSMRHLRRLVLKNNKMNGDLNDFSEAIPHHSKLQWLDISKNQFSGPLFAPALIRLAVFSSMRDEYQTEFDRLAEHIFDASSNQLIGEISQEILQVPACLLLPSAHFSKRTFVW
jgi:hypothetical protein